MERSVESVEEQRPTGCEFNILKTVGNGFLKCFKRLAHSADYKTKSKPPPRPYPSLFLTTPQRAGLN